MLVNIGRITLKPSYRWIPLAVGSICVVYFVSFILLPPSFRLEASHRRPPPYRPPHDSRPPHVHEQVIWWERAEQVRNAFSHAYSGYMRHASAFDELLPVTGGHVNNFNGWHVSLVDALDTLWLLGFRDEFKQAVSIVSRIDFALPSNQYAPFFETCIRYLGGLLSAYALSGEPVLLSRADELGQMLLPAFNTSSGFPSFAVNTVTGETKPGWAGGVLWAEALSNQMEFKYLAHLTGREEYYNKSEHVMRTMYATPTHHGLFPTIWDIDTGMSKNGFFSVGAFADSSYEYTLKQWLLTSQSEPKALNLYLNAANGIINHLLYLTPTRNLLYVTDLTLNLPSYTFEHLSCFLPGLLALGVHTLKDHLSERDLDLHSWASEGLAYTCWMTYADQATGLGPDEMRMKPWPDGKWIDHIKLWQDGGRSGLRPGYSKAQPEAAEAKRDYVAWKPGYLLRPETLESMYLMWRTTGESVWRERGWAIFKAIEKHTKTKFGYASLNIVDHVPVTKLRDEMPSYFLAETLKYLYLLFTDDDPVSLDQWVFNTEGHPLPIFEWTEAEKLRYDIH